MRKERLCHPTQARLGDEGLVSRAEEDAGAFSKRTHTGTDRIALEGSFRCHDFGTCRCSSFCNLIRCRHDDDAEKVFRHLRKRLAQDRAIAQRGQELLSAEADAPA